LDFCQLGPDFQGAQGRDPFADLGIGLLNE
jgi:hypothetical protein